MIIDSILLYELQREENKQKKNPKKSLLLHSVKLYTTCFVSIYIFLFKLLLWLKRGECEEVRNVESVMRHVIRLVVEAVERE